MIIKLFLDPVQENTEGPNSKKRRLTETRNSEGNQQVSGTAAAAMDVSVVQLSEDKEIEALGTAVSDGTVPSSYPNSADTNCTQGNYLLFTMQFNYLKIIYANIYRSISIYDHFGSILSCCIII